MRISCLAITENRDEFAEWLAWQYLKQDYPDTEFILVASINDDRFIQVIKERIPNAIIRTTDPGTWVPVKRNIAMRLATGDMITWLDDDDWTSSERVSTAVRVVQDHQALIPSATGLYYWDLKRRAAKHFKCGAWAYGLYDRNLALETPFDEAQRRATDTKWYAEMKTKLHRRGDLSYIEHPMTGHCLAVSHKKNISNPQWKASRMTHKYDFDHVMKRLVLEPGEQEVIGAHWDRITQRQGIGDA